MRRLHGSGVGRVNAGRIARRVLAPAVAAAIAAFGIAFAADNLPVAAWEDAPRIASIAGWER